MKIDELREKANKLPLLPGVYIMLDETGEVIYVGKAKQLKNRVTSYFRGEHEPKTAAMVSKVDDFNVIVAASEFEALVLENSLIKRHQPHYNILLRDDKSYPFVRLDHRSEYPRFTVANKTAKDGAKYFGPYGGRGLTRDIIDTVSKTLKLPTCGKKFPRDIGKERPCLNYHMGSCEGWCIEGGDAQEYKKSIHQAEMILEGRTDVLATELGEKMEQAAEELRFEQAAQYRDKLKALESLKNRQKAIAVAWADMDVVGFYRGAKCCFTVLHYTGGNLSGKDYELMDEPLENDADTVSALVRQFYSIRGAWPKVILLPLEIEDAEALERLLSEAAGRRVRIEAPKRGDRRALVEAALLNAREESVRATSSAERRTKTLEWLQKALELPAYPSRIEAFDVSNTGSFGIVAAMTVHKNGKPLKKDYRKFRVKQLGGSPDDYASMHEVLTRRFKRYMDGDEKFMELPDLLLIDGGASHAAVAEKVLVALEITLPVYGMVKDDRHRTRALITASGKEIGISGNPSVFALIGNIQEETHRFAIEYHRSLRMENMGSALDSINGVGEKRRNELLRHFKTIKAIKSASFEQLCEAVPRNTAEAVYDHFHKETDQ